MHNSTNPFHHQSGPLTANNFSFSEEVIVKGIRKISRSYDVTCITEKQKTAMSKELYDSRLINAIEHAILSLPSQNIEATLNNDQAFNTPLNLIDIYNQKVTMNQSESNLSPGKAIDEKFLFIMQNIHDQHRLNS
ncbi:MAG: hypothetical protein HRU06_13710 [Oceanospirillaceae bacterium]|nr:hypothetical protein [Oceanospirillaceae bacterium]